MRSFSKFSTLTLTALVLQSSLSTVALADVGATDSGVHNIRASGQPLPEYPRRAELSGIEGYAVVEFIVQPDGRVADASIKQSTNRLFTRAAVSAVKSWEFEPGDGLAETGPVTRTVKFNFSGL